MPSESGARFSPVHFALLALIALAALFFRLPHLDSRPMHTDEAVHAHKLGILIETGSYVYDPVDYHGPTLYYAALPFLLARGIDTYAAIPSEIPLRLAAVFASVVLILLLALLRDALPPHALLFAALLLAVSPAFVFYSRYYIQEIFFVAFTLCLIGSGWRWLCTGRSGWVIAAGFAAGLMAATKETWIISFACMIAALPAARALIPPPARGVQRINLSLAILLFAATAFLAATLLLTNFFANPRALIDMLGSYALYFSRGVSGAASSGEAAAHHHPWWYYFHLLGYYKSAPGPFWTEAPILIFGALGLSFAFKSTPFHRWLVLYTLLIAAVYSILPYKTPWLALNFLLPLVLLGGVGFNAVFTRLRGPLFRTLLVLFFAFAILQLSLFAHRSINLFEADPRNPYVYAHTTPNYLRLVRRIDDLVGVSPDGQNLLIKVIIPDSDFWPLPWNLRAYPRVGYYSEIPDDPHAPVVVTVPALEEELAAKLGADVVTEFYGLRSGVILQVFIRNDLWNDFLRTRKNSVDDR